MSDMLDAIRKAAGTDMPETQAAAGTRMDVKAIYAARRKGAQPPLTATDDDAPPAAKGKPGGFPDAKAIYAARAGKPPSAVTDDTDESGVVAAEQKQGRLPNAKAVFNLRRQAG